MGGDSLMTGKCPGDSMKEEEEEEEEEEEGGLSLIC